MVVAVPLVAVDGPFGEFSTVFLPPSDARSPVAWPSKTPRANTAANGAHSMDVFACADTRHTAEVIHGHPPSRS